MSGTLTPLHIFTLDAVGASDMKAIALLVGPATIGIGLQPLEASLLTGSSSIAEPVKPDAPLLNPTLDILG